MDALDNKLKSGTENQDAPPTNKPKKTSKKSKIIDESKKSNLPSLEEMFQPTKENLNNNPSEYEVNLNQLKLLIEYCQGAQNISSIVKDYTDNTEGLIDTLENLYPLLNERTIKVRFTKIINKLKKIVNETPNANESQMNTQKETLEYIDSDESLEED